MLKPAATTRRGVEIHVQRDKIKIGRQRGYSTPETAMAGLTKGSRRAARKALRKAGHGRLAHASVHGSNNAVI